MKFSSNLFRIAAIYNWLVGIPLLIATAPMLAIMGMAAPADLTWHRLSALLVAIFGIIYWMIAAAPQSYRPLIKLAVAGKVSVFLLFAQAWLGGFVSSMAFGIAVGDLLFGILFAFALRALDKQAG
jgi:hypothetical protein